MVTSAYPTAIAAALSQVGKPYVYGTPLNPYTTTPANSYDCSGLLAWAVYNAYGKKIPHQTALMYFGMQHRPIAEVQPGDFLFKQDAGIIHHVAMYIGNGQEVEAYDTGTPVRVASVDSAGPWMSTVGVGYDGGVGAVGLTNGVPQGTDPHPPIDPTTLKVPLTPAQRTTMLNYMIEHSGASSESVKIDAVYAALGLQQQIGSASEKKYILAQAIQTGKHDSQLITEYTLYTEGGAVQTGGTTYGTNIPGVSSLDSFLKSITSASLWLRILEAVLGLLLLGVAVAKITGNPNPATRIVGKVR